MGKGDDDDLDMDALNKELGDSAGDESYEIEDDADLSGSVDMSANPAGAGAKFPSTGQPGSKPTSVTLDESGGDLFSEPSESGAGLTGRTDSKPVAASKPPSVRAPASKPPSRPASVAPEKSGVGAGGTGGSGGGDGNSNSYNSDEFGDILGPSHSRGELSPTTPSAAKPAAKPAASLASLPRASGGGATPPPGSTRGPGSQPVSGHATPVGAPGSVSGAVPPSPHHVTFSPDTSLRPPQPTDSPGASRVGRLGPGPGLQHSGSRRTQTRCDIPTPFELFRLYDKDNNGSVALAEFSRMLRDLEGRPHHFPQEEDPEWRLEKAQARKKRREAALAALESKLTAATEQPSTPREALEEIHTAMARMSSTCTSTASCVSGSPSHAPASTQYCSFGRGAVGGRNEDMLSHQFAKLCKDAALINGKTVTKATVDIIYHRPTDNGIFSHIISRVHRTMQQYATHEQRPGSSLLGGCRPPPPLTETATPTLHAAHTARTDMQHKEMRESRAADEALETYVHKAGVAATARMYYPQFLFALNKLAEKRKSGFQEVVALILQAVDALPEPSFADFVSQLALALSTGALAAAIRAQDGYGPPPGEASKALKALVDARRAGLVREGAVTLGGRARAKGPAGEMEDVVLAPDGDGEGDGEGTKRGGEGGAPGAKPQTLTGMLGQSQEGAPGRRLTRDESGVSQSAGLGGTGVPVRGSVYAGLPPPDLTEEALRRKDWEQPEPQPLGQWRQSLAASGVHPVHSADMMHQVRGLDPDTLMASLKRVFETYAGWGGGVDRGALDRVRWGKVLRDCLLVSESGPLPARKADAVFGKVLPVSSRALNFIQPSSSWHPFVYTVYGTAPRAVFSEPASGALRPQQSA
eukprot:XP_001694968.1 predicted protein [Chlamydomonas reinhardtii]